MLELVHLAFVGAQVSPAIVHFGSRLTLVRGPSDTGKSFIVSAIDFMLGSQDLQYVPQRDGYTEVLLGVRVDGFDWTLTRSVNGGKFFVFEGLHEGAPVGDPQVVLSQSHNDKSSNNLSMWILEALGLAGSRLRKNVNNVTVSLSFRDIAHLVVIDETKMQAPVPPAVSGSHVSRTKELSALRLLLEAEDDSHLPPIASPPEVRRLKGAKLEVIDQLIGRMANQLAESGSADELRDQLVRLNVSLDDDLSLVRALSQKRISALESRRRDEVRIHALDLRIAQRLGLIARFKLLGEQYRSDIGRLDAVIEGGNLLGYFNIGVCPLCGADPSHQQRGQDMESRGVIQSALAQREETQLLVHDLAGTIVGLELALGESRTAREAAISRVGEQTHIIRDLEKRLKPHRVESKESMQKKSEVEAALTRHAQLEDLRRARTEIDNETVAETRAQASAISAGAIDELSRELFERLDAWGYPFLQDFRYDRIQNDIYSDRQFRADHGKGVRAILHAAFTVALAQYCLKRHLPHPGFVVLDSPVVTYRAPESDDPIAGDLSFATRIYADLQENFLGQSIVMENTDPDEIYDAKFTDIVFSKRSDRGRYGFFPTSQAPSEESSYPFGHR
jgi:hypothetical protein